MCGIAGFWRTSSDSSSFNLQEIVVQMSQTLYHRGPDSGGVWVDESAGIALGHRRLAIVDLSEDGHQPMISERSRYIMVFNGEIYNFLSLRKELIALGHKFRGYSDTEIMLASFEEWGVEKAVKKFNGMFAFALWDAKERLLHIGRDRVGEKPLYYGYLGNTLVFASELKAIQAYPDSNLQIDRDALALFLRYNYILSPHSIYKGIYKLPPGTLLSWNGMGSIPTPQPYWRAQEMAINGLNNPLTGSDADIIEQLNVLIKDAVKDRMLADVPLGAFLSGGIDSSTVVAIMQYQSPQPIKTFTIGFEEEEYNEAPYAKAIAQHLGTNHTEMYVTAKQAMDVIPKIPHLYDEPFADASQIPTFLVSQLAKSQVTAVLSGDGGDELFGGYDRYSWGANAWRILNQIPPQVKDLLAQKQYKSFPSGYLGKIREFCSLRAPAELHDRLITHWKQSSELVIGSSLVDTIFSDRCLSNSLPNTVQLMTYLDVMTYLPDDILVKVDRASMGASLEARSPLLDPSLIEFAWRLPPDSKITKRQTKWWLRQVLSKYLPTELFDRPKKGFGIPIGEWLRSPLKDWGEYLLDENRMRQQGFLNPEPIRQKWLEHLSGKKNWEFYLWDVLIFQAWLENQHG